MNEIKNLSTVLPYGAMLKPLIASSKELSISDLKCCLSQKGIFTSSSSKEELLPLMLTSLLTPMEFDSLREQQKSKEATPKRKSRSYNYIKETELIKTIPIVNAIKIEELKNWEFENYKISDYGHFVKCDANNNKLVVDYKIERTDYAKDWFNHTSVHEASVELTVNPNTNKLVVSSEYTAEETKEVNELIIKKVCSALKDEKYIDNEKPKEIRFGDFSNENRINFLLNFVEDNLDKTDTFKFSEITNIDIFLDSEKNLPKNFEWMEDKVSNVKFEGKSLHETEVLQNPEYHPSLIISLLKINYSFETKLGKGDCVVEVEFPTKRREKIPSDESGFVFKIVKIKCENKTSIKSTRTALYRTFDNFKESCFEKTQEYIEKSQKQDVVILE